MGTHPIFESDFDCLTDCRMDADQAFEIVTNGKSLGWYSYYTFGLQLTTQILVAFQMCLMVILTPILTDENDGRPWHLSEWEVSLASSIYMLGVGRQFCNGNHRRHLWP